MRHQLLPPHLRRDSATPAWPSFMGTAQPVGTSADGRTTVYYDPNLGQEGLHNAQDLVDDAARIATDNDAIFGATGGPANGIVFALNGATDGTGGADHLGCDFVNGNNIEVCAAFGNSVRVSALFEAELSECSMGGNLCGVSTGEALSRWCAAVVSNNALADFASAPVWAQQGMPDFVTQTDPTDQNPISIGCGMAFLSWFQGPTAITGLTPFRLPTIAQAMVALGTNGTLAQLYADLTGDTADNALSKFMTAVQSLPNGVTGDDPFGGFTPTIEKELAQGR